jgi:hypothetical protein
MHHAYAERKILSAFIYHLFDVRNNDVEVNFVHIVVDRLVVEYYLNNQMDQESLVIDKMVVEQVYELWMMGPVNDDLYSLSGSKCHFFDRIVVLDFV